MVARACVDPGAGSIYIYILLRSHAYVLTHVLRASLFALLVLRASCLRACVLRAACCVLRAACCILRPLGVVNKSSKVLCVGGTIHRQDHRRQDQRSHWNQKIPNATSDLHCTRTSIACTERVRRDRRLRTLWQPPSCCRHLCYNCRVPIASTVCT